MIPSEKCYNLIKEFEGCRLTSYLCPASIPTIGWGSTMYPDGSKVLLGQTITQERADILLEWEVIKKSTVIDAMGLKLNQSQFDAVVCFAYNVGLGSFNKSTIKKLANINPNNPAIRDAFMMWSKARVGGVLMTLKGLERRRRAEADLYFSLSI